jgi:hypothetical protein
MAGIPHGMFSWQSFCTNTNMNSAVLTSRLDRLGAGISFACAIHCAIMPFVIAILPFVGYSFLANERLENMIIGLSILLAAVSVWSGVRVHGQHRILFLFGAAFVLIIVGRAFAQGPIQLACTVPGGLLFVCGHFVNHRLRHRGHACCEAEASPNSK